MRVDDLDHLGLMKSGPEDFGRRSEVYFRHAAIELPISHVRSSPHKRVHSSVERSGQKIYILESTAYSCIL